MALYNRHLGIYIYYQSGQFIAFTMRQPKAIGDIYLWQTNALAHRKGIAKTLEPKVDTL
jgi:hypothetical protein